MSFYEVKLVTRAAPHTVLATFDADPDDNRQKASIEETTQMLNEAGMFSISVPTYLTAAAQIVALKTELQVFRDGAIIHWGIPVQSSVDVASQSVKWVCPGLLWYWHRLNIGPVQGNRLLNPRFAVDLSSWTAVGCTATWQAFGIRGPGTAQLVSTAVGDNYLQQTFVVPAGGALPRGLTLAAWCIIDSLTAPAFDERGIYIQAPDGFGSGAAAGVPVWEPITMSTPRGQLVRLEAYMELPANHASQTVTTRLSSPHGTIRWGATSVTEPESISAAAGGTDAATLMAQIAAYAEQKNGHNILVPAQPASGTVLFEAYQLSELPNVLASLQSFPIREYADFGLELTPTTRTFRTYAPKKGVGRSYTVTVPGSSLIQMAHTTDGEQTASSQIRQLSGSGSDREVAVSTDTSALDGLLLETVGDAPAEVDLRTLDGYTDNELARFFSTLKLPRLVVPAQPFFTEGVQIGDNINVNIDWGAVQQNSVQRVISWTLNPAEDTLALELKAL